MADFNLPLVTTFFASVISIFKDRDDNLGQQFRTDLTAPTNLADLSIRWNSTNRNWEELDVGGLAWSPLVDSPTDTYGIDVNKLDGQIGSFYLDFDNLVNVPATQPPAVHSHDFGTLPSSPSGTLQLMRGTTAQIAAVTGLIAEIHYDTTLKTLVVHDAATAGGFALGRKSAVDTNAAGIATNVSNIALNTAALPLKAPLASPVLTGNPTAPTQTLGNDTTRLATTAFVKAAVDTVIPPDPEWLVHATIYDFAIDGLVASVETSTFVDGFEYRLGFDGISPSATGIANLEYWLETTAAWATVRKLGVGTAAVVVLDGVIEMLDVRWSIITHGFFGVLGDSTGLAATQPFVGAWSGTAEKITKARFSFSSASIDAGVLTLYKRAI